MSDNGANGSGNSGSPKCVRQEDGQLNVFVREIMQPN